MPHNRIAYYVRSSDGITWHPVQLRAAGAFEELTACGRGIGEFPVSCCTTASELLPTDVVCEVCKEELRNGG